MRNHIIKELAKAIQKEEKARKAYDAAEKVFAKYASMRLTTRAENPKAYTAMLKRQHTLDNWRFAKYDVEVLENKLARLT